MLFTAATSDGRLRKYLHNAPENGANDWESPTEIGNGWYGRLLAGPGGRRYTIQDNGEFRRLRYVNGSWEVNPDGTFYKVIANTWTGWSLPEYRNRITFDTKGDLYAVPNDGNLWWYRYNETDKTWTSRIIATGWGHYDLIAAAGDGVIYARDPRTNDGVLTRSHYDSASHRWLQQDKPLTGSGWNMHAEILSPGADILYGRSKDNTRDLYWYRWHDDRNVWSERTWIGSGWGSSGDEWQVAAAPDACRITGRVLPQRPATRPISPLGRTELLEDRTGQLNAYYVNSYGQVVLLHQREGSPIDFLDNAAIPSEIEAEPTKRIEFATTPNAVVDKEGKPRLFALATDGDSYETKQQGDTWAKYNQYLHQGGWTLSTPEFVKYADGRLQLFGVDATGRLLERHQDIVDGPLLPWRTLEVTGLTGSVEAQRIGDSFELVATDSTGVLRAIRYTGNAVANVRTVDAGPITGTPTLVLNPDNRVQIFARRGDGKVHTLRDTASGFEPAWRQVHDVAANGSPAAVISTLGVVKLTVWSNDGYVYVTEQVAAGSPSFKPWTKLTDRRTGQSWPSDTEPSMLAMSTGKVVVVYRNADEMPFAFEQAVPGAAGAEEGFTGGPRRR